METMEQQKFSHLGERERKRYNEGLERKGYDRFFSHCRYYYTQRRTELVKEYMQFADGKKVLEIGSGSGALTLYLYTLLKNTGVLYSLDSSKINQRRADKTISRYISTLSDESNDITFINQELINFEYKTLNENIDAIITDVPEPWEFFTNNKIKNSASWVSYLPSMTQVMRMNDVLKEQQFQDIEIKEVILRDWVVDEKIVRPSNKLVSHTGFLISARYIEY